jgi:hypothetical protein
MSTTADRCTLTEQENPPGTVITMEPGTIKRIHVDQHRIKENKKTGIIQPVITVQWKNRPYKARVITIEGPSSVVYSPYKALSCGAHVWVETTAQVVIVC